MQERAVIELVRREFVVEGSVLASWERLAQVEDWPSWARHIKRVQLHPAGALTAGSDGCFWLVGGVRSTFRMEVFDPPRRWQWVGPFLTVRAHYDHRFEAVGQNTRLIWTVNADGFGANSLGRVFGAVYSRNLDRAIPRLQAELHQKS